MNFERYKRNIEIEKIGESGQKKLLNSKVLIAGAGGLGSSVISALAGVGIGTIGIIDFDVIEISNLNRQFIHKNTNLQFPKALSAKSWVNNFNPEIQIKTYNFKLEENNSSILDEYDLIVDCFDSYESKFLLNKLCVQNKKILVHGGVTEFQGQITVINPFKTACLNCLFNNIQESNLNGSLSPVVSTIGSLQALEIVKVVLGLENILENILLSFDGITNEFKKINISKNPNCNVCSGHS